MRLQQTEAGSEPAVSSKGRSGAPRRTPSVIICPRQSLLILCLQRTLQASVTAVREDGRHAQVNEVQAKNVPAITFYYILWSRTSLTIQMSP